MKKWAVLTVFLYVLAFSMLMAPTLLIAFGAWGTDSASKNPLTLRQLPNVYLQWGWWLPLTILVTGQMLLLLVPIDISERRLPARRSVRTLVVVTAFFFANLVFAGVLCILSVVPNHLQAETIMPALPAFWILWGLVFRKLTKSDEPQAMVDRMTRWMLRGSILELLIAIPSHIIVRRRGDCCAPMLTFWGIATGISVMLLCFGPGVFFLYAERFKRLQPKSSTFHQKELG